MSDNDLSDDVVFTSDNKVPLIDERNIVITDNTLVIAVENRSEAERLVTEMMRLGMIWERPENFD